MNNCALIFYLIIGSVLMTKDKTITGMAVFITAFSYIMSSQSAGNALIYGPDIGKAIKAGITVFKLIAYPT